MVKLKRIASNLLLKHSLLKKLFAALMLPPPMEGVHNPIIPRPSKTPEDPAVKVKALQDKYTEIISEPMYGDKTNADFLAMLSSGYIKEESKKQITFTQEAETYLKHLDKVLHLKRQLEELIKECDKIRIHPVYVLYEDFLSPALHDIKRFLEKKIQKRNLEQLYGISPDPVFRASFGPKFPTTSTYTVNKKPEDTSMQLPEDVTEYLAGVGDTIVDTGDTMLSSKPMTSLNGLGIKDLTLKYVEAVSDIQYFSQNFCKQAAFVVLAGFPSRKDTISKFKSDPQKLELIEVVWKFLELHFQNKASKFFPIVFDYIDRNPNSNIQEILDDAKVDLKEFDKLQGIDINSFNSFEELHNKIQEIFLQKLQKSKKEKLPKHQEHINAGDSTKLYEDNQVILYRINSPQGANALAGSDTSWCIARKTGTFYNQYTSSNQIFYFGIDKTLPLDDPKQKVAIRVTKNYDNNIVGINYTSKKNNGDNKDPDELSYYPKVQSIIQSDAAAQPPSLLSKVKMGIATEQEKEQLWQNYKSSSLSEKETLNKMVDFVYNNKLKEIIDTKFDSIPQNWKELDAALIEKLINQFDDDNFYNKVLELHNPFLDKKISENTNNKYILLKILHSIPENDDLEIKKIIAEKPNLLPEAAAKLANDPDKYIRQAIAVKPNLPPELFAKLANDPDDSVRQAIAVKPNLPPELFAKLANDPDAYIRRAIAVKPNLPPELFAKLANDPSAYIRRAIAVKPNLPPELFAKLANDPDDFVRRAIAKNPNLPPELFAKLANDPDDFVRHAIAEKPNLPPELAANNKVAFKKTLLSSKPMASLNGLDIKDLTLKYVEAMSDIQFQAIENKFDQKQEAIDNELIAGKITSEKHILLCQRLENEKSRALRDLNNEFKSQLLGTEKENLGAIHRVRKNTMDMRDLGRQMQDIEEDMDRRQHLRKNLADADKTINKFKTARSERQAKIASLTKIQYQPKSNLKLLATSIRDAYIMKEAAGELLTPEHLQNMPEGWRQGFQRTLAPEVVETPKPVTEAPKPVEAPVVDKINEPENTVPDEVKNVKAQPSPSESQLKVKQKIIDMEARAQNQGANTNITDLNKEITDFEKMMWDENGTPKDPNVSRADFDNYRKRTNIIKEKVLQAKYTKIRTEFSGNSDRLARELEEFEKTLVQDNTVTELGKQYGLNVPEDLEKIDQGSRKMARNNRADREWRKMKESFINTWENADLLGPIKGLNSLVKSLRIRYPGWTTVAAATGAYCLYRFMFGPAAVAKTGNKDADAIFEDMDQTLGTDTNIIAKLGNGLDIVTSDLGDFANTIGNEEEKKKIVELATSLTKTKNYLISFKAVLDLKDKASVNNMFENSRKITQICQQWSSYIPSLIESLDYPNTEDLKQTLRSLQIIFTQIPEAITAIKEEARK